MDLDLEDSPIVQRTRKRPRELALSDDEEDVPVSRLGKRHVSVGLETPPSEATNGVAVAINFSLDAPAHPGNSTPTYTTNGVVPQPAARPSDDASHNSSSNATKTAATLPVPVTNGKSRTPSPSYDDDDDDEDMPLSCSAAPSRTELEASTNSQEEKKSTVLSNSEAAKTPPKKVKEEKSKAVDEGMEGLKEKAKMEPVSPVSAQQPPSAVTKPTTTVSIKKQTTSPDNRGKMLLPRKGGKMRLVTEENFEPINLWWENQTSKDGKQWKYLEHHGLIFAAPYAPHNIPVLHKDEEVALPPDAEEVANFWCTAMDSPYGEKEKFIRNFWRAFQDKLPDTHTLKKASFEDCDFKQIRDHLINTREALKEQKKQMTKAEKEMEKKRKDDEEGAYTYALVDWLREKVATFKTEPATLFRGRGEHPKMGMLKTRIFPENVTINCDEDAPVPMVAPELRGHSWKDVYHDNSVSWLAYYKDSINQQFKYIFLGAGSAVKGQKDYAKYEKARRLKHHITGIRKDYTEKLVGDDITDKQLGTATYLIDVLALRVGNEKDQSEEADTVGCCSLRVEHIHFDRDENNEKAKENAITLDFLGKDSIRYLNTVVVDNRVYNNLRSFCKAKSPSEDIFEKISTGSLNKYLKDMMVGLSAKVFRTYNASITLQQELAKLNPEDVDVRNPEALKRFYEDANRTVAILCNHQRSVPKQHETSMGKMQNMLDVMLDDIAELEAYLEHLKKKSSKKFKFAPQHASIDDDNPRKTVVKEGMKVEAAERKLAALEKKKTNHMLRMKIKDDNKTVSNSTSKQHYMDPRITVAFCKRWELPIERLFNTTLRKKFPWAMYARSDFEF